jgi:hypothetical protein
LFELFFVFVLSFSFFLSFFPSFFSYFLTFFLSSLQILTISKAKREVGRRMSDFIVDDSDDVDEEASEDEIPYIPMKPRKRTAPSNLHSSNNRNSSSNNSNNYSNNSNNYSNNSDSSRTQQRAPRICIDADSDEESGVVLLDIRPLSRNASSVIDLSALDDDGDSHVPLRRTTASNNNNGSNSRSGSGFGSNGLLGLGIRPKVEREGTVVDLSDDDRPLVMPVRYDQTIILSDSDDEEDDDGEGEEGAPVERGMAESGEGAAEYNRYDDDFENYLNNLELEIDSNASRSPLPPSDSIVTGVESILPTDEDGIDKTQEFGANDEQHVLDAEDVTVDEDFIDDVFAQAEIFAALEEGEDGLVVTKGGIKCEVKAEKNDGAAMKIEKRLENNRTRTPVSNSNGELRAKTEVRLAADDLTVDEEEEDRTHLVRDVIVLDDDDHDYEDGEHDYDDGDGEHDYDDYDDYDDDDDDDGEHVKVR